MKGSVHEFVRKRLSGRSWDKTDVGIVLSIFAIVLAVIFYLLSTSQISQVDCKAIVAGKMAQSRGFAGTILYDDDGRVVGIRHRDGSEFRC